MSTLSIVGIGVVAIIVFDLALAGIQHWLEKTGRSKRRW